ATALMYVLVGRPSDARPRFESACDEFMFLPRDATWLPHLGLLGEACALLGDTRRAAILYPLLAPFADMTLIAGPGGASFGSAARIAGLLAATLGRQDEALAHIDRAVQINERAGALAWLTQSLHDRAAALLARDGPQDRESAAVSLARARALALRLGMDGITAARHPPARPPGQGPMPRRAPGPAPRARPLDRRVRGSRMPPARFQGHASPGAPAAPSRGGVSRRLADRGGERDAAPGRHPGARPGGFGAGARERDAGRAWSPRPDRHRTSRARRAPGANGANGNGVLLRARSPAPDGLGVVSSFRRAGADAAGPCAPSPWRCAAARP